MSEITRIQFYRGAYANLPLLAIGEPGFATDSGNLFVGNGTINVPIGGPSLIDGDYGDVTVSAGGSVITLNDEVVTAAKMAALTNKRAIGRNTAGDGTPEEVTVAQMLGWLAGSDAIGNIIVRGLTSWEQLPRIFANNTVLANSGAGPYWEFRDWVGIEDRQTAGTHGGAGRRPALGSSAR